MSAPEPSPVAQDSSANAELSPPAGSTPPLTVKRPLVHPAELVLLASVFVVAACGLVYELAAGALASYLLGDSVLQFSTIIGAYLFAMGLGSWLSRFVEQQLVAQFLRIELLVGLIGGCLPAALFIAHGLLPAESGLAFRVLLYGMVLLVGTLVGLEIPLVMRILKRQFAQSYALKDLVSQVLTFDYLGALLVPHLGLVRTGLFFGLLNAAVAVWALWLFRGELRAWAAHAAACAAVLVILLAGLLGADRLTSWAEDHFYGGHILLREHSAFQRIVVTGGAAGTRLFLNGNLQFHARDEYRYHEALVHPALLAHGAPRKVLVLGGGDGLAVREVLKHPQVEQVTLVELDPAMTRLFSEQALLKKLNGNALLDPRVRVEHADAFQWLQQQRDVFDVVIIDFPDPSNFSLGKLYTTTFYESVDQHLAAGGFVAVQSTSPLVARRSFWTVVSTIEAVGLQTWPYHVHVPSFGEWGFVLAGRRPLRPVDALPSMPPGLRFLTPQVWPTLFQFPPDMSRVKTEVNRLSNQVLVHTFEQEWGQVHEQ
jgi:spermidine synthase